MSHAALPIVCQSKASQKFRDSFEGGRGEGS